MTLPFKHTLSVRFVDVDALGHTNNAHYFTYFEEARVAYFNALGYSRKNFVEDCIFILAHASCDYKSPSFFNETLDVYTGITELKNSSFVMEYEIKERETGRLVALGKTVQVTFDYKNKRVIRVPQSLKDRMAKLGT